MNKQRAFILGLGHQKCGTSWLHHYLCQSDIFAEGEAKEYHIWDRLDIPLLQHLGAELRAKMYRSPDFYFDYFDGLMSGSKLITADITPSYSGLKAERLKQIKHSFSLRDINVKVVVLVREPLSRIKSAVRFNLDRKNYSEGISPNEDNFERALLQYYKTEHCSFRTRYQNIICEALKAFSTDNIYIGFFESMFEESEVKRLSEFLEIDAKLEFAQVFVNKTRNPIHETSSDALIKEFYADTYNYFFENYSVTKKIWL